MDAPWGIDGPMNRVTVDANVETKLAPALGKGDVIFLDNPSFRKGQSAASILRERGALLLFLPSSSPDLNLIGMTISKLKAVVRKTTVRTCENLWRTVGNVCGLFTVEECFNVFNAAGYGTDETQNALKICACTCCCVSTKSWAAFARPKVWIIGAIWCKCAKIAHALRTAIR